MSKWCKKKNKAGHCWTPLLVDLYIRCFDVSHTWFNASKWFRSHNILRIYCSVYYYLFPPSFHRKDITLFLVSSRKKTSFISLILLFLAQWPSFGMAKLLFVFGNHDLLTCYVLCWTTYTGFVSFFLISHWLCCTITCKMKTTVVYMSARLDFSRPICVSVYHP